MTFRLPFFFSHFLSGTRMINSLWQSALAAVTDRKFSEIIKIDSPQNGYRQPTGYTISALCAHQRILSRVWCRFDVKFNRPHQFTCQRGLQCGNSIEHRHIDTVAYLVRHDVPWSPFAVLLLARVIAAGIFVMQTTAVARQHWAVVVDAGRRWARRWWHRGRRWIASWLIRRNHF